MELETYNILRREKRGMIVMKKVFEVSYEIEKFDSDLISMMNDLGTFQLLDTVKHNRPIWADEWYIDRYTYKYEWNVNNGMESFAERLFSLAINNDILN